MDNSVISIIIPIYNKDKDHIKKCIMSIMNQTLINIEIIIINDGSTNNIELTLQELADKDKRIIICNQKNQGVSAARNKGLDLASSPYIMFVDADDWIDENCCETLFLLTEEKHLDVVFWTYVKEYDNHSVVYKQNIKDKINIFDQTFMGSVCKVLYKKDVISNNKFNTSLINGEDVEFNFRVFKNVNKYEYINLPFYHYRIHDNSAVRKRADDMIENYVLTLSTIKENCFNSNDYSVYYSFMSICYLMIILNHILISNKSHVIRMINEIKKLSNQHPFSELKNNLNIIDLPLSRKIPIFCLKYHLYLGIFIICKIKKHLDKN